MIDTRITGSYKFYEMSSSAQALFLALIANADDDGVCEGNLILRISKRRKTDLKELVSNGYVTVIEQSQNICYINDWQSFNTIRAGRGRPSSYRKTLVEQIPNIKNALFKPKNSDFSGQNVGAELVKSRAESDKSYVSSSLEQQATTTEENSFSEIIPSVDDIIKEFPECSQSVAERFIALNTGYGWKRLKKQRWQEVFNYFWKQEKHKGSPLDAWESDDEPLPFE